MRDNRDILDKLRWLSNDMEYMEVPGEWLPPVTEAAAEIKKLRAALEKIASHNGNPTLDGAAHKIAQKTVSIARTALEGK